MKVLMAAAAFIAALSGTALADGKIHHPIGKVDRRVDQVDRRVDQADRRADQIDRSTDKVDRSIDQVDRTIDQVDRTIDQAAARILAGRIGDIRGGFAPDVEPAFFRFAAPARDAGRPTVSAETTASTRVSSAPTQSVWIDGLARARDPLAGRVAVGL